MKKYRICLTMNMQREEIYLELEDQKMQGISMQPLFTKVI